MYTFAKIIYTHVDVEERQASYVGGEYSYVIAPQTGTDENDFLSQASIGQFIASKSV